MKVCIVGGGLAGLACAISLARTLGQDELHITLLELRDFSSKGATFGLAQNGQKALEEICPSLLEELKAVGILMPEGGYMLPWYLVRDGLLKKAREMPEVIQIMTHTRVTSISQDASSVTINAEEEKHGSPAVPISMQVDIVIGADGLHSTVRKFIQAPLPIPSNTVTWRGFVDDVPQKIAHYLDIHITKGILTGPHIFCVFNFNPTLPGTLCWVVSSKETKAKSVLDCLGAIEDEKEREDFRTLMECSPKEVLEENTELCTVPLDDGWGGEGRITLIGDAAHAIRPASGLGGALAFEDVVILTRELAKAATDPEAALRAFEQIRLPRCKAIQDDQTKLAEAGYMTEEERKKLEWLPAFKDWIFMGPDAPPNPPSMIYVGQMSS